MSTLLNFEVWVYPAEQRVLCFCSEELSDEERALMEKEGLLRVSDFLAGSRSEVAKAFCGGHAEDGGDA